MARRYFDEEKPERSFVKIFSAILFLLIILFFWGEWEDLNLSSKINDSKFNNFFASVGALLTGLSILYASLQIVESKKSREVMFLPNILPKDTLFSTRSSVTPLRNVLEDKEFAFDDDSGAYVEFFNAGPGLAKKVSIIWDYDGSKVIQSLIQHRASEYTTEYPDPPAVGKVKFVYIAPNQFVKVDIPQFYFQLYRSDINAWRSRWEDDGNEYIYIPPLIVKMNYLDIFGRIHVDKYYTRVTVKGENRLHLQFQFTY